MQVKLCVAQIDEIVISISFSASLFISLHVCLPLILSHVTSRQELLNYGFQLMAMEIWVSVV